MIEQIRFSRRPNKPKKNTLFTILDGDSLYYGISKCNKTDAWNRDEGVKLAKARAMSAKSNDYVNLRSFVTKTGLVGKCPAKDVVKVLQAFRRIR